MGYRLSWRAEADLEALYLEGFDLFGEARADAYIQSLAQVFELLGANPKMARLRYEIKTPPSGHTLIART
jgi:toxin ParE1/3/4